MTLLVGILYSTLCKYTPKFVDSFTKQINDCYFLLQVIGMQINMLYETNKCLFGTCGFALFTSTNA